MEKDKKKYDSIILLGDTGASRQVYGTNKALLKINGIPSFIYVLKALGKAEKVDRICLIGPKEKITQAIENHSHLPDDKKEIIVLEQGSTLFSNAWKSFLYLYPEAKESTSITSSQSEKAVLYIPGDVPLTTPFEIDTFLNLCEVDIYDYFQGFTPAESLYYFYPQKGKLGITSNYFYAREGKYRHNNLHLVKPLKVANREYIQKVYDFRYQRDFSNIAKLAIEFIKAHVGLQGFWCYGLLHWHQLLSRMHLSPLTVPTRKLLPLSLVERCVSSILGTRFTTVTSPLAGTVLDIDNENDFQAMCEMFVDWQDYQSKMNELFKEKHTLNHKSLHSKHDAA